MDKDAEYDFTDDQIAAALEMQKLHDGQLEDDEWDPSNSIFSEMDYSSFVSQRLKEVNEQWDKEPLPDENLRHKSIEFKKDKELTSVYEPAPYSEEDDPDFANDSVDNFTPDNTESNDNLQQTNSQNSGVEENGSHSPDREDEGGLSNKKEAILPGETMPIASDKQTTETRSKSKSLRFASIENDNGNNNDDLEPADKLDETGRENVNKNNNIHENNNKEDESRPTDTSPTDSGNSDSVHSQNQQLGNSDQKEEKVLVELNGKFELISVKEYEAMGYSRSDSAESPPDAYSQNQRNSRPKSSVESKSSSERKSRNRAQSASANLRSNRSKDWDASHYTSPYGLTPEQRELKERREKIVREREAAQRERKMEEEKRKQEEAESAFQWWLETKRENQSNATAAEKQKKEEEERARREENEAAFEAWCEAKKEQHKRQRLLQNREQKERDDAYIIHSRDECDKAFKQWLRNKRQEQNMYYSLSATKNKPKKKKPRSRTSHSSGSSLNRKPDWSSKTR